MRAQLPNQLTILRAILAALFFLSINWYRYHPAGDPRAHHEDVYLIIAMVLFILGAITDALDGYLARKWKVESTFGRIMDPFCDKVLVIGAFIYLAGPRFINPVAVREGRLLTMITGVYPWMVCVILARELLVTGIRGELEGEGVRYPAMWSGKWKMILQCVGIPIIMLMVMLDPEAAGHAWMAWTCNILMYAIVIVTVISVIPYISSATRLFLRKRKKSAMTADEDSPPASTPPAPRQTQPHTHGGSIRIDGHDGANP